MWILRSSETDGALTFRLPLGIVKTIGRSAGADFIVDVALVSRLHCQVTAGETNIDVEDMSSTNGTFVNDTRIDRGQLASGDRLRVGRVELTVERQV